MQISKSGDVLVYSRGTKSPLEFMGYQLYLKTCDTKHDKATRRAITLAVSIIPKAVHPILPNISFVMGTFL